MWRTYCCRHWTSLIFHDRSYSRTGAATRSLAAASSSRATATAFSSSTSLPLLHLLWSPTGGGACGRRVPAPSGTRRRRQGRRGPGSASAAVSPASPSSAAACGSCGGLPTPGTCRTAGRTSCTRTYAARRRPPTSRSFPCSPPPLLQWINLNRTYGVPCVSRRAPMGPEAIGCKSYRGGGYMTRSSRHGMASAKNGEWKKEQDGRGVTPRSAATAFPAHQVETRPAQSFIRFLAFLISFIVLIIKKKSSHVNN